MSIAVAFDTHEFIKNLESAGMPRPQAEVISKTLHTIQITADVATKADLEAFDTKTEQADGKFAAMDGKFALQMDALQNKLLIKLSLVMAGLMGLMVTAQRFFP